MILAAQKGKNGERYILATESSISTTKIINMARDLLIDIKKLNIITKEELIRLAMQMEEESKITHKPPLLLLEGIVNMDNLGENTAELLAKLNNRCSYTI